MRIIRHKVNNLYNLNQNDLVEIDVSYYFDNMYVTHTANYPCISTFDEYLSIAEEKQVKLIEEYVPEKYRLGKCFTSSINNYNISAPFHRDTANIKGCVNVIITKKKNATGGDLHVPDYNATMNSSDNSMLVYPAWRNVHGVTPIVPTSEGGYRNSLVFYPLASFKGKKWTKIDT